MRLLVREFGRLVGALESTPDRGVVFAYDAAYLADPEARALSLSLPLREKPYPQAASMPFFAGLLPDGEARRKVADYLHVSETSTLKLLDALGGECAGTISIQPEAGEGGIAYGDIAEGESSVGRDGRYMELSQDELAKLVIESERRPLLIPREGIRLSLAGAQDKIPLRYDAGRWFLPLDGAPSSHILKPSSLAFEDLVYNEFFCMRFAEALGLPVARVDIIDAGRKALLVRRYDRELDGEGRIVRVRQEDFCQALGIMPDKKYEADGGPGFAAIASTLRKASANPLRDIRELVRIALFNLLVGNCDAHGKNFSLLYKGRQVALAPFYDLVSTAVYPELSGRFSMRFGGVYGFEKLRGSDIEGFAAELGVGAKFVLNAMGELASAATAAREMVASLPELRESRSLVENISGLWDARAGRLVKQS
jgi:serine/threonine-protein kinase HipA